MLISYYQKYVLIMEMWSFYLYVLVFVHACKPSTRLRWTKEMASLDPQPWCLCLLSSKWAGWIIHPLHLLFLLLVLMATRLRFMGTLHLLKPRPTLLPLIHLQFTLNQVMLQQGITHPNTWSWFPSLGSWKDGVLVHNYIKCILCKCMLDVLLFIISVWNLFCQYIAALYLMFIY